jgi:hypothetical protein
MFERDGLLVEHLASKVDVDLRLGEVRVSGPLLQLYRVLVAA